MKGFVKISKYAGMREDLVQAGGGNSSYKMSVGRMVIKASGYQLAEVTEEEGYSIVDPDVIRQSFLEWHDLRTMTEEEGKKILQKSYIEGKRPSIETFLHAISGKYTLHTHPTVVNALACRKNGMNELSDLFPEALLVPYATPGVKLAKEYFISYKKAKRDGSVHGDIVFLQNHGLLVSADTPEEIVDMTENVVKTIEAYLSCDNSDYHNSTEIWKHFPNKIIWMVTDIHILGAYEIIGEAWNHTFCPDSIVFLGKRILDLTDEQSMEKAIDIFISEHGIPVIIRYKGQLYIVADSVKKAMETQSVMSFSAQVMFLNKEANCNYLSDQEQNFLLDWDAEKYRKNMK